MVKLHLNIKTKQEDPPGFLFVETVRQASTLHSYFASQLKYRRAFSISNHHHVNSIRDILSELFTYKLTSS